MQHIIKHVVICSGILILSANSHSVKNACAATVVETSAQHQQDNSDNEQKPFATSFPAGYRLIEELAPEASAPNSTTVFSLAQQSANDVAKKVINQHEDASNTFLFSIKSTTRSTRSSIQTEQLTEIIAKGSAEILSARRSNNSL
ncbi:hypothetical protein EDC56_2207 [Sinobacterium caligoides]|uniref:Uncharacterized protein n=1 Tax=Sinobacterium caligoides TaxID=933926 RepID=A0A3N2DQ02_9GAMM|nr:hypothetical protein [Sinobacterium caligoides]ROS01762.1 hypothetical protein EDC56_2207 [Sinobacterium caligoides]